MTLIMTTLDGSQDHLVVYDTRGINLRMSNDCGESKYWINIKREAFRHFYAPNIFSPNEDGYTDYFTLVSKDIEQIELLRFMTDGKTAVKGVFIPG